jgi:hypothetical protein
MATDQFTSWRDAFLKELERKSVAEPLKEAAIYSKLSAWTASLTTAVVDSCHELGWRAAGKGHKLALLPKAGQEYLGIDVMAFTASEADRWPFPLAAFELENSPSDDRVAYSLWKVLCLRVNLRLVFAYRPDWEQGRELVQTVCKNVIGTKSIDQRTALKGQTVLVVGNRGEGETFPWGYFKFWKLDTNLGRFEKV